MLQISSTTPLAVQFYDNAGQNRWTLNDTQFNIMNEDVIRQLGEPRWELHGSRVFYIF